MHPAVNHAPRDPSPSKIPRWLPRDSTTYKPSKLDLMKEEYQRKMLKEKERKIIEMYENNQRKALDRLSRADGRVNRGNSVRNFFEERRALETTGNKSSMQEIQNHYNRFKKDTRRRSSVPDVPQTVGKKSAGRDRDHPLAPIDRANVPENYILTKPQRLRQHHVSNNKNSTLSEKPLPKTIKSKSAPSSGKIKKIDIDSMDPTVNCEPTVPIRSESDSPPDAVHLSALKRKNSINKKGTPPVLPEENPEKLTDFQKWQLEQVRIKEERLSVHRQQSLRKLSGSEKIDSDEGIDSDRENIEDEIVRKQNELMEKIAQQQADLDRMKEEKEKELEKERRDEEKRQQRAIIEREKQAKKEKERERQRKEAEVQRKEEEKKRKMEEEENTHYNAQRNAGSTYRRDDYDSNSPSTKYHQPHPPARKKPSRPPPRNLAPSEPEEALTPIPGPDVNFYLQAASQDNGGAPVQMSECPICGRRFNVDRLSKHQAACQRSNKKRKVFDPTKMRTQGTEMAQFVSSGNHKEEKPTPKKSDWRIKRDNFIKSIQYAKKVNQIERQGGNIRDITPPPPAQNPDYVKCPHCQRSFNQSAAERHIPRCKDIKGKPAFNTRKR